MIRFDSTTEDPDRKSRIDLVVQDVMERLDSHRSLDVALILKQHEDLMPELGERLRMFRDIEKASKEVDPLERTPVEPEPIDSTEPSNPPDETIPGETEPDFEEEMAFLQGKLPEYNFLEALEYGGQGIVFHAIEERAKREVAVKVLLDGPLARDSQRYRFKREIRLLSRMKHPNIVTVYANGILRNRPFYVMEFIEGLSITEHARQNNLSWRERVRMFITVCRAIGAAHQRGVIHRDLKPSNILIDAEDVPKILDFGLAKDEWQMESESADVRLSAPGMHLGTLEYVPPEQAVGEEDTDSRADIYSLGVVLFELVTEHSPYVTDGTRPGMLEAVKSQAPLTLSAAIERDKLTAEPGMELRITDPKDFVDDLQAILFKALQKDREGRYDTAGDLADDLERLLLDEAVLAKADNRRYRFRKLCQKYRVHARIAVAFMFVIVAAFVGITTAWKRAEETSGVYQQALAAAGFGKIASAERDRGRLEQAEETFRQGIKIANILPSGDPSIPLISYSAQHQLAEMYMEAGRTEEAATLGAQAMANAQKLVEISPDDTVCRRRLGFAYILQGRVAHSRQAWEEALIAFTESQLISNQLLSDSPQNATLRSDLAFSIEWLGTSHRKLNEIEDALTFYAQAISLYQSLLDDELGTTDDILALIRSNLMMATSHLIRNTDGDWHDAEEHVAIAKTRIAVLQDSAAARTHSGKIETLFDDIRRTESWMSIYKKSIDKPTDASVRGT